MSIKITIDPGHGRTGNPFFLQEGYYEGTQMWKLANFLKAELENYGFEVVTTRPHLNDDPTPSERGRIAGENGSTLFLSLHSNATVGSTITKSPGTEIFHSMTYNSSNKLLSDQLGKKIAEVMNHPYRGSKTRERPSRLDANYYGETRAATESGCKRVFLIEHGSHTNIKDSTFLIEDENLQKLASVEAKTIYQYFKWVMNKM